MSVTIYKYLVCLLVITVSGHQQVWRFLAASLVVQQAH